jgi:uncharacterized membrane protein
MRNTAYDPLLFLCLGLIAYSLPWVSAPSASLTLGAYDLAEWASLHPAARTASPVLLPPLLLRLGLVWLLLIAAYSTLPRSIKALVILIGSVALLPPLEFFVSDLADVNYRQQLALAIFTLIVGLIGVVGFFRRWTGLIQIALAAVLVVTVIWGNLSGYNLMIAYQLPAQIALGGWLCGMLGLAWGIRSLLVTRQQTR